MLVRTLFGWHGTLFKNNKGREEEEKDKDKDRRWYGPVATNNIFDDPHHCCRLLPVSVSFIVCVSSTDN